MSISRRTFPLFAAPLAALLMLAGAANAHAAVQLDSPAEGSYTNDRQPQITFTGSVDGDTVELLTDDGTSLGQGTAGPGGTGTFMPAISPSGQNVALHLHDIQANESTGDFYFNQVPIVTASGTGREISFNIAHAISGGWAQLYVDGVAVNGATADGAGNITDLTPGRSLPSNNITATTFDAHGNESDPSAPITVDAVAPDAPAIDSPEDDAIVATQRPDIAISGAEAGSTVKVYSDDDTLYGSAVAPAGGDVTIHGAVDLPQDNSSLTATATDAAGNESDPSDPVSVTVDTEAPAAAPHMLDVPGDPSSSTHFRFYAHGGDTAQCRVADGSGAPWTVCQDNSANGSFEPQLADGQHTVEIREIDEAGNVSPVYRHTWTLDTHRPRAGDDHQRPGRDHHQRDRDVRVHLRAGLHLLLRHRPQPREAVQRGLRQPHDVYGPRDR